jgi:hypothetical protein
MESCINHWPSTQLCMECKHGAFINDEDLPGSTYACLINVDLGPCESVCHDQVLKRDDEEERFLANDPIEW